MKRIAAPFALGLLTVLGASVATARPRVDRGLSAEVVPDRPLAASQISAPRNQVLGDTLWIADWTFDGAGGSCDDGGWTRYDGRILNDGSNYWSVRDTYAGMGGIVAHAAVLSKHDLSWPKDGYGNNWDYSIVLKYQGPGATIGFDYLCETEPGYDFVTIEADSAGASESRVDYTIDPTAGPSSYRTQLLSITGYQNASVSSLSLPDFGVASEHEVYIRFDSGEYYSDEDGLYPTTFLNAGLVVDNIAVGGGLAYTEDFEGVLDPHVALLNTAAATPFGEWARLHPHISDNDRCSENTTCAWLVSDPILSAYYPDMAFGPGGAVIRRWLDDIIVSPWVAYVGNPSDATVLSYRRFPGNNFGLGRIVQNWSIRSKIRIDNTDTSVPGDSIDAVTPWGHAGNWNSLTNFQWITSTADMTGYVEPGAFEIQIRFRVSDWGLIAGASPPATLDPGPGPFVDRVRIGRRILTGPRLNEGIDARSQAQDCFPTFRNSILPGEHFSPTTDRFGTCAFSRGTELMVDRTGPRLVTGDSITITVYDQRGAGGITSVDWYGAIVSGPHAGKAPPPYTVGGNGLFAVVPDSARGVYGSPIAGAFFVDFDEDYFRGGDVLLYFWAATDAGGGFGSDPDGMTAVPGSVAEAELATGGLLEVSFLPTNNWDPGYLARIAADPNGKLDPTPAELAGTQQRSCMLYVQMVNFRRRSGDVNRTSFMYTLDRLGYRGYYDTYDFTGFGNTGNHVAGRATIEQCTGYALIVNDYGRTPSCAMPDGIELICGKFDQAAWFQQYLAQGSASEIGTASLWLIGDNVLREAGTQPLLLDDMGVTYVAASQTVAPSPDVEGSTAFTWADGGSTDFTGEIFSFPGQCVTNHATYDAMEAHGSAVVTHRYRSATTLGEGAVVMNRNVAEQWNTILCGFSWSDIRDASGEVPGAPDVAFAGLVLGGVLPAGCLRSPDPTDVPPPSAENRVPARTALYGNAPNPFNPVTTIRFDLHRRGPVDLTIYDVMGRRVRRLASTVYEAGKHAVTWNGLDDRGARVASGVYVCRMRTDGYTATRKMLLVE